MKHHPVISKGNHTEAFLRLQSAKVAQANANTLVIDNEIARKMLPLLQSKINVIHLNVTPGCWVSIETYKKDEAKALQVLNQMFPKERVKITTCELTGWVTVTKYLN